MDLFDILNTIKWVTQICFQYFLHSGGSGNLNSHCLLFLHVFCLRIQEINTRHHTDLFLADFRLRRVSREMRFCSEGQIILFAMTKKTRTRRYAVRAKVLSTKDSRIVENQKKKEKEEKERKEALVRHVEQIPSSMFFK